MQFLRPGEVVPCSGVAVIGWRWVGATPPEQLTQVIGYFFRGGGQTHGASAHHTSGHDHSPPPPPPPSTPASLHPQT